MEFAKDFLASMREWLKQRFSSPFFAAFVVTWCVTNWRVIMALCADGPYLERIRWVDFHLYPAWWHWAWFGGAQPALVALAYVIFSPPIYRKLAAYHRRQQHATNNALLIADQVEHISPERAAVLVDQRLKALAALKERRKVWNALEAEYVDEDQRKTARIQELERAAAVRIEVPPNPSPMPGLADRIRIRREQNTTEQQWHFEKSDFLTMPEHQWALLEREGLAEEEAKLLAQADVQTHVDPERFAQQIGLNRNAFRASLIRLKSMGLVYDISNGSYTLSDAGVEAIRKMKRTDTGRFKALLESS